MSRTLPPSPEESPFATGFHFFPSRGSESTGGKPRSNSSTILSSISSTLQSLHRARQTLATGATLRISFERHLQFTGFPPQAIAMEEVGKLSHQAAMEFLNQPLIYHSFHFKPAPSGSAPLDNTETVLMAREPLSDKVSAEQLISNWRYCISIGDLPLPFDIAKAVIPSLVLTRNTSNGVDSYLQGPYGLVIHTITRIEIRCGDAAGPLGEEPLWLVEELEMKCPWPLSLYMGRMMRKNFESGYEQLRTEWDARTRILAGTAIHLGNTVEVLEE
jgi:hypothetical protein